MRAQIQPQTARRLTKTGSQLPAAWTQPHWLPGWLPSWLPDDWLSAIWPSDRRLTRNEHP